MSTGRGRVSRRQLVLGAGATLLASASAGCGADAAPRNAGPDARDAGILAGALRVEHALVALYGAARPILRGDARDLLDQEREHAAALERAIRDLGVEPPRAAGRAADTPGGARGALRAALALEERAVRRYGDAVARLADPALRVQAAAILTSEAGHAAVLRAALGEEPVPGAFGL